MLKWSEPRPPIKDVCRYDHVTAVTPWGVMFLEWSSWKKPPDDYCATLPGDDCVGGDSLEETKRAAQNAWDEMVREMAKSASSEWWLTKSAIGDDSNAS